MWPAGPRADDVTMGLEGRKDRTMRGTFALWAVGMLILAGVVALAASRMIGDAAGIFAP